MKEAMLYQKLENNNVQCNLCARRCKIGNANFGFCGVRENIDGTLYTHTYAEIIAAHIDPIEKKPLYHFLPGSTAFSIAAPGCNLRCKFCQNWQISQITKGNRWKPSDRNILPGEIVNTAMQNQCRSIAYTYTEPTVFFEYAYETAVLAKEKGIRNTFVTNGYMTEEALNMIKPHLDSANVDLKFFNNTSYKEMCAAELEPVLNTIKLMNKSGIWVEITTLIIPGINDSYDELKNIAGFISSVDKNIPWHISRFHPDYKYLKSPKTPLTTLQNAEKIAKKTGLRYVYIGNVYGEGEETYCPECGALLIKRSGFDILENNLTGHFCNNCKTSIAGVFQS